MDISLKETPQTVKVSSDYVVRIDLVHTRPNAGITAKRNIIIREGAL